MRKILTLTLLTLLVNLLNAQETKIKFGKISKEELLMKYYEPDSSANAVILYDKGITNFQYDNEKQKFKYVFERHVRIKIFNKKGFDEANIEIPLYKESKGTSREDINNIKGKVFNLINGEVIKTKLEKRNIFFEETSKNLRTAKVSFPNIKEGCIIDLKYTINSVFLWNLQSWRFQYEIPVVYSEYSVIIPEYFNYHKMQKGYDNINLTEETGKRTEIFTIQWGQTLSKRGDKIDRGSYQITSKSTFWKWKAHNIPAFKEEAYMTTYKDYIAMIDFELKYTKSVDGKIHSYTSSWDDIAKELIEDDNFGRQFKLSDKIKEQSSLICLGLTSKKEKLYAIYKYVQNNFKWNSYNSIYTSTRLSRIFEKKVGNSADINLLLMNMLRAQSIQSNPIILSTRQNGKIFPIHPTIKAFNYVIIEAKVEDEVYFLDATIDIIPIGNLPKKCLNGYGRKILSTGSTEVNISPKSKESKAIIYLAELSEDGIISANVNEVYKGYAAIYKRDEIINSGGYKDYIKKVVDNTSSEELSEIKISNLNDIDKPLKFSYNLSTADNITVAGNIIYLSPMLNEGISKNPFILEDRRYPVDYAYPIIKKTIIQYIIPEGFSIEELPKSTRFSLEGRTAQFQYNVVNSGNKVQIICDFRINNTIFQYEEYKALKNFYNLVIEKQKEQIVFKKID